MPFDLDDLTDLRAYADRANDVAAAFRQAAVDADDVVGGDDDLARAIDDARAAAMDAARAFSALRFAAARAAANARDRAPSEGAPLGGACQCGDATGVRCQWTGPIEETVVVEWMPEHLRASHAAARNRGAYPANGALRLRVHRDCAELLTHEPTEDGAPGEPSEWASIVGE